MTIILTTHYIEEAEAIADRIAVIAKGSIRLVEEKAALMKRLGQKSLTLELQNQMDQVPEGLSEFRVVLSDDGTQLIYEYDTSRTHGDRAIDDSIGRAGDCFERFANQSIFT